VNNKQDRKSGVWGFIFILACVGSALKYGPAALGLYTDWAVFGLAATVALS